MKDSYIDQLSERLKNKGILYAFGVSGSGDSLNLITSLEAQGVRYFPVAHEASAALMAGACCRKGKTNGVGITIKGPGFSNLVPGILSNMYENRPALTISEAYGSKAASYQKHKRLDHFSVCSSIVKGFASAGVSPNIVDELINTGCAEIPGPVHLDLNSSETPDAEIHVMQQKNSRSKITGVRDILDRIASSNRPAVILGSLVTRCLSDFTWDKIGVPVVTTVAAKGAINEESSFSGGVITGEIKELSPEQTILSKADLIVAFGLRNTEVIRPVPFQAPLIIVDAVDTELHHGFEPDIVYVADDIIEITESIIDALSERSWGGDVVLEHWRSVESELFAEEWLPAQVIHNVQDSLEKDTMLTLDTGLFCIIGETVWKSRSTENFCGSSVGRFMGTAIPTAIGIAISSPGRKVVCAVGDGGVRPYLPEIRLAVEEKLPILFLLISDGRYGTIALSARSRKVTATAYDIPSSTWWKAVEAMGCPALKIESLDEMNRAIVEWMEERGPLFLEMHFESEKYINSVCKLR